MRLQLTRLEAIENATLGELRVEGQWFCWTLEDLVRAQKIKHETAIPAGEYEVRITHSARFGVEMPEVLAVPGFAGIRIHPGNSAADTSGCILVGMSRNGARIGDSRDAFAKLMQVLQQAHGEVITLKITQPEGWPAWNGRATVDLAPPRRPAQAMTGPLGAQPAIAPAQIQAPLAVPPLASIVPPAPLPGASPDDPSRLVSRDAGKSWVTTLLTWAGGIAGSVGAFLQHNYKLVALLIGAILVVTIIYQIGAIIADYQRRKIAADPHKYNVH